MCLHELSDNDVDLILEAFHKVWKKSKQIIKMKKINFEDIKKYSDLPKNIKFFSNEDIKYKTKQEVLREFNAEKWSLILNEIASDKKINLHEIDKKMEAFDVLSPIFYKMIFILQAVKRFLKCILMFSIKLFVNT